jgi:uncharacterized membrane protein
MSRNSVVPLTCGICARTFPRRQLVPAQTLRTGIVAEIEREHPEWIPEGFVCHEDLNRFRETYIQGLIEADKGEITTLESEVVESLKQREILSRNVDAEFERDLSPGDRLSDTIASFGGSWRFIILFGAVILVWITLNAVFLVRKPFDPYPFILLNLVLSCIAAMQAPVIMMSQNRQEARDRLRSQNDYQVNMKAELEIRQLHEKVDHLLSKQWERLMEIQQLQLELMSEMTASRPKRE